MESVLAPKTTLLNLFDIIVDPAGVAERLADRRTWLYPLLLIAAGSLLMGIYNLPLLQHVAEQNLPAGLSEEQVQETLASVIRTQKIGLFLSPLGLPLKWLLGAALLFMSCVLLDIRVKYQSLFALLAQCGLITFIQDVTVFLIIRLRAEKVETIADLSPRLGLDLVFTNLGPTWMMVLNYFSVFTVAYILALTLALSVTGNCTKGKAFLATIPNWLLPLCIGIGFSLF